MKIPDQIIARVEDKVLETYLRAQSLYGRAFELPSIEWNLRGRCAGRGHLRENRIRLNPVLLSENTEHFIAQVLPHEVAHLVNRAVSGPYARPHGPEWKAIMRPFGLPPLRCHNYDVTNAAQRNRYYVPYYCGCDVHLVADVTHRRICRGQKYHCRRCGRGITEHRHPPKAMTESQSVSAFAYEPEPLPF